MHLYGMPTGQLVVALLLFTTNTECWLTTNRERNAASCGHWEVLKDICKLWSLENIALIYSASTEYGK
jgi:hypothetical protein